MSVWRQPESAALGAGLRRLLASSPLPPPERTGRGQRQRLTETLLLLRRAAALASDDATDSGGGGLLFAAASAALRSRYDSDGERAACINADGSEEEEEDLRCRRRRRRRECAVEEGETAFVLSQPSDSWCSAAAAALRALRSEAERAIVLANLAEAALMRMVGLSRGAGGGLDAVERARELVDIVQACF